MLAIDDRLKKVLRDGNLTVADLARWFDRRDPTVRGWVNGTQVGGAQMDSAFVLAQLDLLERKIKRKQGFPVPRLTPSDRIAYLNNIQRNGK